MQEVQLDTSPPRTPTSSGTSNTDLKWNKTDCKTKNDRLFGPHKSVVHMKRIYKIQLYKCYILSFKTPFDIFIQSPLWALCITKHVHIASHIHAWNVNGFLDGKTVIQSKGMTTSTWACCILDMCVLWHKWSYVILK
jgi:hypothetical protein